MKGVYRRSAWIMLTRPWLLPVFLSAAWAFRSKDWFRRPPFLPLPSAAYLKWRMETAYGDGESEPPAEDFIRFLKWSRAMRKEMGRG
ncbi:MAG: hypothetical protein ACR2QM_03430 [Longimicrobiales bacterium]